MKKPTIQPTILLALATASASAATVWLPSPNALASASWDSWSIPGSPEGLIAGTHSQGNPQATTGSLVNVGASGLDATLGGSLTPPAGVYGGGDRVYSHAGSTQWAPSVQLTGPVSFVRVSYSLFQDGAAFAIPPVIPGATPIGSNSYSDAGGNSVYYHDFQLPGPSASISTLSFGDPNGVPSFRSFDSLLVEVFNSNPAPVPEPSSALLGVLGAAMAFRRKRA